MISCIPSAGSAPCRASTSCRLPYALQMEQTVAHARMEQQLYGGASRARDEDARVISGKSVLKPEEQDGANNGSSRWGPAQSLHSDALLCAVSRMQL